MTTQSHTRIDSFGNGNSGESYHRACLPADLRSDSQYPFDDDQFVASSSAELVAGGVDP